MEKNRKTTERNLDGITKKTNRSYKKARIFLSRKNYKKKTEYARNRFQNIIEQGQQKIKRMWKTIQKVMCEEDKQTKKKHEKSIQQCAEKNFKK